MNTEVKCKNCGLRKATCEMPDGDEWVKNCQKVEGNKHDFGVPEGKKWDEATKIAIEAGKAELTTFKNFVRESLKEMSDEYGDYPEANKVLGAISRLLEQ